MQWANGWITWPRNLFRSLEQIWIWPSKRQALALEPRAPPSKRRFVPRKSGSFYTWTHHSTEPRANPAPTQRRRERRLSPNTEPRQSGRDMVKPRCPGYQRQIAPITTGGELVVDLSERHGIDGQSAGAGRPGGAGSLPPLSHRMREAMSTDTTGLDSIPRGIDKKKPRWLFSLAASSSDVTKLSVSV